MERAITQAEEKAGELGVKFTARQRVMEEALVCAENPVENCVFTVDGKIAPCIYLHLPTKSETIPRWFMGRMVWVEKTYFSSLEDWIKSEFRNTFKKRLQILYQSLPVELPELPEVCKTCYKAYSV